MIKTIRDKRITAVLAGRAPKGFPVSLVRSAQRKLAVLDSAASLDQLRAVPGNRLEALKGDRRGQWSIRINNQWRLVFRWKAGDAEDVEIADYH